MSAHQIWTVEVYLSEDEGETTAVASLRPAAGHSVRGFGSATAPQDPAAEPATTERLAVARALADLSGQLLLELPTPRS